MILTAKNMFPEILLHKAEMVDLRQDAAGVIRRPFRFPLSQGGSVPLWQEARTQAIGFRQADLERTHWKKVRQSMFEE